MKRWLRDTLFLRLFLLMWVALVVSHVAAFGFVTSGLVSTELAPPPRGAAELPTFPSLPPTPGLPGEARRLPLAGAGPPSPTEAPRQRPEPPRLPTLLLVVDYAVRLLVIGAAAAVGARWLTAPVRRLVRASDALARSLAGQVIMEGFLRRRIPLAARRLVTIAPAIAVLAAGVDPVRVLILSQVALTAGLPFALIPLTIMTSRRSVMGTLVNRRITTMTAVTVTAAILALNGALLAQA